MDFNWQKVTPRENLQRVRGIADKMKAGSTFRQGKNGWEEYDMFGNPVGGPASPQVAPAVPAGGSNSGATNKTAAANSASGGSDPAKAAVAQSSYGGVSGNYGSGNVEEKVPPAADVTTGDKQTLPPEKVGGDTVPPVSAFEPITIAAATMTSKNGRNQRSASRLGGMQLTQAMLSGVPETDIAKLREAAAKGPGAFTEFMKANRSAPWYATIADALKGQIGRGGGVGLAAKGVERAQGGGGMGYENGWMRKRREENEAKANEPKFGYEPWLTPYREPGNGMPPWMSQDDFVDANGNGFDDRTERVGIPYGDNPYGQQQDPRVAAYLQAMQQQGGPQQNPPFDPRILQMLMGGQYGG